MRSASCGLVVALVTLAGCVDPKASGELSVETQYEQLKSACGGSIANGAVANQGSLSPGEFAFPDEGALQAWHLRGSSTREASWQQPLVSFELRRGYRSGMNVSSTSEADQKLCSGAVQLLHSAPKKSDGTGSVPRTFSHLILAPVVELQLPTQFPPDALETSGWEQELAEASRLTGSLEVTEGAEEPDHPERVAIIDTRRYPVDMQCATPFKIIMKRQLIAPAVLSENVSGDFCRPTAQMTPDGPIRACVILQVRHSADSCVLVARDVPLAVGEASSAAALGGKLNRIADESKWGNQLYPDGRTLPSPSYDLVVDKVERRP